VREEERRRGGVGERRRSGFAEQFNLSVRRMPLECNAFRGMCNEC
jgi:hypothetical protein